MHVSAENRVGALALIMAACATGNAVAEEAHYDQVSFTVQAESELQNDLAEAVLEAESEASDPARLADDINRTMTWALDLARDSEGISSQTADYQTYPVYDDQGRLLRWRGSQGLVLRSEKIAALTQLAATLQQRLQIKRLQFTVSPGRERDAEVLLTDRVLARFKERAARIQHDLDAKGYRIVSLDLQQGGEPRVFAPMGMAMAERAPVPIAAEAGISRLRLSARVVIQLQR